MQRQDKHDLSEHLMGVLVIQLWDDLFLRNLRGAAFP
jgi:hypothetical protein